MIVLRINACSGCYQHREFTVLPWLVVLRARGAQENKEEIYLLYIYSVAPTTAVLRPRLFDGDPD